MIRVFNSTDRDFKTNGNAVLVPIKARVKNNLNGDFYIEITCESKFYDYLNQGDLIIAPTPQGEQAFRIGNQLTRKGDRITLKAYHVYYDTQNLVIADSYAVDMTCKQALDHFNAATDTTSPFKMASDINSLNTFRCVRKSLQEAINTVIERWGGYLVRDNWNISVLKNIGVDYGITIRYAQNLKELTAAYDFSGVATKILPVGKDGILLPELYVYSNKQYDIPYTRVVSISQDIDEDDYSTEAEYQAAVIADLRQQAQEMVNKTCIPTITYTLKGNPEIVQDIGDTIQVIDERIGVNITTQVIGYEWDVITEDYASLTFGNFGNTLSGLMAKVNSDTKGIVNEAVGEVKSDIKSSVSKIYDLLQGSFVVYRGYDILLLDKIPMDTATNVIKFDRYGISTSNTGVNGDFTEVYNIKNHQLTVPSINLNGNDLQSELNSKLTADDIEAGNNIKISRSGNKVTISSTGGGLKYWTEAPDYIQRRINYTVANWDCDSEYKHGQFHINNPVGNWIQKKNTNIACCAFYSFNGNTYPMVISTVLEDAQVHAVFIGDYVYPFTLNGVTLYFSRMTQNATWGTPTVTGDVPPNLGDFTDYYTTHGNDSLATQAYVRDLLIEISNFHTSKSSYSGIGVNGSDYVAWGGDQYGVGSFKATPQKAPFNVYRNGIVNGKDFRIKGVSIDNVRDVQVNGTSVVTNKVANVDLSNYATKSDLNAKQDTLIAGNNITIDADGKTINAEVPSIEANPADTATDTLNKLELDGVVYNLAGGGGNATYYGTGTPSASLGVNGDTYYKYSGAEVTTFNYLKMIITKNRSNDTYTQLSDVVVKDSNGNNFAWTGTSVSGNATDTGEGAGNLIDGSTGTKYCAIITPTVNSPLEITFTLGNPLNVLIYNKWSWYTANDVNGRDPVSFAMYGSDNGTDWYELDSVENANITTNRWTLAYTGDLTPSGGAPVIEKEYIKIEGAWVENELPFEVNSNGELCMVVYEE